MGDDTFANGGLHDPWAYHLADSARTLVALLLVFAPVFAAAHAAEHHRRVTVVSFGLFGPQGVFRREATAAAQIVASRFGADPVVVRFNTKTGGDATVQTLAATLQAEAKKMNGESDIPFLILASHGSRDGSRCHRRAGDGDAPTIRISPRCSGELAYDPKSSSSAAIPELFIDLALPMPIHS